MSPHSHVRPGLSSSRLGAIQLGTRLGRGGEGEVFEIAGHRDLVAKIYHGRLSGERVEKLKVMQVLGRPELQQISAWPVDLIHEKGVPRGFVMPRAENARELHVLYGPKSRKQQFPDAGFAFLVQCAANVARAFAVIHDSGLVIGDVNDRLVMVSRDATVRLIDCDSFQVEAGGKRYPCEVGVGAFTPPELQGQSFRGVVRTANHDNFGLAVLLFHLLFLGRHPFAGRSQDGGDAGIEAAIENYRFAYSPDTKRTRMLAPPGTVSPTAASPELAQLFEQAFGPEGSTALRPCAGDWAGALTGLASALKDCPDNRAHAFHRDLARCPWCALEAATGWELFHYVPPRNAPASIDVEAVWAAITGITFAPIPQLSQMRPKSVPPAAPEIEMLAEAVRREAGLTAAAASSEKARQALEKAEDDLRQHEAAVVAAEQHALGFDGDRDRLAALHGKLVVVEREERRQNVWNGLIWLQLTCAWIAATRPMWTVALTLTATSVGTGTLAWLCRRGCEDAHGLVSRIAQLNASLAQGPERRWAIHQAAITAREKAAEVIGKAQTNVYKAKVAETAAREHLQALGDAIEPARRALERQQRGAASAQARMEARYSELEEQRRQLEAFQGRRVSDLAEIKRRLDELSTGLKNAVKSLKDQEREAQLSRYLDQFFIAHEDITGLGPVLKSTLASFGIETAADINQKAVRSVPGFGPGRTQTLLAWRRTKQAGFRFVPGQTDPAKRAALERQNMSERRKHEHQLRLGLADLETKARAFAEVVSEYEQAARPVALKIAIADHATALATGQIRGRPW